MPKIKPQTSAQAIVIGVSAYDDKDNVKPLEGAVPDAIAYVEWLIEIGLDPADIVLHVSPDPDVTYKYPSGVVRKPAKRDEIWNSFASLIGQSKKKRLFVCASGHGVQTKEGTCFLTQDFHLTRASKRNLCIDLYIDEFLRGLPFEEQYLFIDCCSNYLLVQTMIQTVVSGGPEQQIPQRTPTQLHTFYACKEEERAQQSANGRGIFSSAVLEALSPAAIDRLWIDYEGQRYFSCDFEDGRWHLELSSLFSDKIARKVETESERIHRKFTPRYVPTPSFSGDVRLYELDGVKSAELTITANPENDLKRLDRVTASLPAVRPELSKHWPIAPFKIKVPIGQTIKIFGDPTHPADRLKARPLKAVISTAQSQTAFLEFEPKPSAPLDPRGPGSPSDPIIIIKRAPGEGSVRPHSDIGEFEFSKSGDLAPPSGDFGVVHNLHPVRRSSRKNVLIKRSDPNKDRVEEGLSSWAVLELTRMSKRRATTVKLARIKAYKSIRLEPDRYLAEINLPWGSWREVFVLNKGDSAVVEIPNSVGTPPLRFEPDANEGITWSWYSPLFGLFEENHSLFVASYGEISIRRSLSSAQPTRYEPYSETSSPLWDILITNKRPRMADRRMLDEFALTPPEDISTPCLNILRLAAAYALLLEDETRRAHAFMQLLPDDILSTLDGDLIAFGVSGGVDREAERSMVQRLEERETPLLTYGYDVAARWLDVEDAHRLIPHDEELGPGAWTVRHSAGELTQPVELTLFDEFRMVASREPEEDVGSGEQEGSV